MDSRKITLSNAKSGTFGFMSLEATGVLLALVSSDKVAFVTYMLFKIGFFWFRVRDNETTGYQNIHQTSRRNMAISHVLENVNNFMQIFEPTLCELKPAECNLIHVKEFGCLARDQNLASVFSVAIPFYVRTTASVSIL